MIKDQLYLYTVLIPARDESESLPSTIRNIYKIFLENKIPHEILVINDGSTDNTEALLISLISEIETLRYINNTNQNGFGRAIILGLNNMKGDSVVIMMADASDDPNDAVKYWNILNEGYECAFGSRFIKNSKVIDYPQLKLFINRIANSFIRIMFAISLNDTTNAFKAYRKNTIEGCKPYLSPHFNLTVELPLKAIVRGYSYSTLPITWKNRKFGVAKLKIKEMGSRYFFICMYVWLEKYFSRGDYYKNNTK